MQAKKILIIMAHPDDNSFCRSVAEAYRDGAAAAGHEVDLLSLNQLQFNPILQYGYKQRTPWEPDLEMAWERIQWCDHMVWVYPTWWGVMPALMKGFIDRVFLPGKAFQYRKDSVLWDKLLKGRSARLITTMDSPAWYNALVYRAAGHHAMKQATLAFCGVKPVRITTISEVRWKKAAQLGKWLEKIRRIGSKGI